MIIFSVGAPHTPNTPNRCVHTNCTRGNDGANRVICNTSNAAAGSILLFSHCFLGDPQGSLEAYQAFLNSKAGNSRPTYLKDRQPTTTQFSAICFCKEHSRMHALFMWRNCKEQQPGDHRDHQARAFLTCHQHLQFPLGVIAKGVSGGF